jgi:predicted Zn-dependent protease
VEALLAKLPNLSDVAMYLEVEAMAEARKRYVDTFKDAYDLVRDFDRLSNDILERASNFSLHLSHSAVERDKSDAFSRAFMSAALHQLGLADGAELVPLEAIRRFPDDAVYQSDLAKLLAEQGRVAETEALYRETAKRLLDDVVSRTALARLLAEK